MKLRNRTQRKTAKLISNNLDAIYNAARNIAKDWDKNTIPVDTLRVILDKSKPSVNTGIKELDLFNMRYGKTLDTLFEELKKISRKMDSKSVPLTQLKNGINIIKKAFTDELSNISKAASA